MLTAGDQPSAVSLHLAPLEQFPVVGVAAAVGTVRPQAPEGQAISQHRVALAGFLLAEGGTGGLDILPH
jgi:hypothetical protein